MNHILSFCDNVYNLPIIFPLCLYITKYGCVSFPIFLKKLQNSLLNNAVFIHLIDSAIVISVSNSTLEE